MNTKITVLYIIVEKMKNGRIQGLILESPALVISRNILKPTQIVSESNISHQDSPE